MEELGQISLLPDLEEEIEEEDRIRLREEEDLVEALLFSLGRSVSAEEIAICLNMGRDGALLAAERLRIRYEESQGGLLIKKLEDRYQMVSHPKTYDGLIRVVKSPRKPVLSDVALETLSIIAYCQPVTKVEVERIRGVKSDHAVNRLVEFGLIEEVGRLDAPGRPMLFATTEEFLNRFGVDSLKDLPALPEGVEKLLREEVTEELKDGFGLEAEEESEEAVVNNEEAIANNEEAGVNNEEAEGEGIDKEEPFTKDYFDIEDRKDEEAVKEEAKAESPET
ncbi:segregation and condensation protein B [Oribacterium parvum ACB1]|uniref:Segregation and condensation protein B n=1 Tax=Oribacterium parvum ACB1 TaxID=796943 RepID=G9WLD1_9FIRM|nr:SMC-Scp complex subunit ScpB [Oribacterium parvum]EHL12586.1 segregation and condensation protein B [Oribacterium parvum ACB1]EJF12749.1 segregation and condensation protein B [Oribacterium parvum ACB8]